jgi:CDP-glycerol glycerophosphotransferase (TagB/SpsB family)
MDMCASLLAESDETYEIIVKIHPSVSLDEFKKTIPATNTARIKLTDLGFAELLPTISVLVSASSSVCSEAALIGIPVAILGSASGPTMNAIPAGISEESSAICYSLRDLQAFLGRIKNIDNREIALSEIIQPVSTDGVKQLFLFRRDEDTL